MSYSPAVSYVKLSPNFYKGRTYNGQERKIDTITIHHTAGVLSVEALGADFANKNRKASSNYGVGNDGRIACYVEEENTAWTSSSRDNDSRAITIEVVNSKAEEPWPISEAAFAALCGLLQDVCRRNGIKRLLWRNDPKLVGQPEKQNMTIHRWFSATACPGSYLYNNMGKIAEVVNLRLAAFEEEENEDEARMVRCNTMGEIKLVAPWAEETVKKLVRSGVIQGHGDMDQDGFPSEMDLSLDMLRLLVFNDRAGLYD